MPRTVPVMSNVAAATAKATVISTKEHTAVATAVATAGATLVARVIRLDAIYSLSKKKDNIILGYKYFNLILTFTII